MKWEFRGKKIFCLGCNRRMLEKRSREGSRCVICPQCGLVTRIGKPHSHFKEPGWLKKRPGGKGHGP